MPLPYVIKTDGLAAGKGVLVTESLEQAKNAIKNYLSGNAFGPAGETIVIEEGLTGNEISILAICDGVKAVPLSPAQDYKRLLDDDNGPNTGGMGAYSPIPSVSEEFVKRIMDEAVHPTLQALIKRGIDYRGVLYAGIMNTAKGPKILESISVRRSRSTSCFTKNEIKLVRLLHEDKWEHRACTDLLMTQW